MPSRSIALCTLLKRRASPRLSSWGLLFWGLWLLLSGSDAQAQYLDDGLSAAAMGMGGAQRILSKDASAVELNPALLASFQTVLTESDYRYAALHEAHAGTLATVDNRASQVGAAVVWRLSSATALPGTPRTGWVIVGEDPDTPLRYLSQDYRLGIGVPLGDAVALGATLGYTRFQQGPAETFSTSPIKHRFVMHGALQWRPSPFYAFALVGNHLAPTGRIQQPTTLTLAGAAHASQYLLGEVDLTADFTGVANREQLAPALEHTRLRVRAGGGILVREYFPLKVGYLRDEVSGERAMTAGAGIVSPRLSLQYAVRYALNAEEVKGVVPLTHVISIDVKLMQ